MWRINDADYQIRKNRVICPYYKAWAKMLHRCYSGEKKRYNNCFVVDEWHSFMTFRAWMMDQDWQHKQLDKDIIIPSNKKYGPDTCCFVTHDINMIFQHPKKNKYGTGISKKKGELGYNAVFRHRNKSYYVGYFLDLSDALQARCLFKANYLESVIIPELKDQRIINGILSYSHF